MFPNIIYYYKCKYCVMNFVVYKRNICSLSLMSFLQVIISQYYFKSYSEKLTIHFRSFRSFINGILNLVQTCIYFKLISFGYHRQEITKYNFSSQLSHLISLSKFNLPLIGIFT